MIKPIRQIHPKIIFQERYTKDLSVEETSQKHGIYANAA